MTLLRGAGAIGASSLMYLERRRVFQVFPDNLKTVWKRWEVEVLILVSLVLQFLLITMGHRRKYLGHRTRTRFLIWSAYLLADWVATVALGVISQNTLDDEGCDKKEEAMDELMCFWAPFLLIHLGGPDTITAYSLEDNQLWLRHLVGLIIQTGLSVYILLVALPGASWLPLLSIPILIAGFIKYGERTLSLRSAHIEHLRDSMLTSPDPGPNYAKFMEEFTLKKAEGYYVQADEVKELPVLADHSYPSDKRQLITEAFDLFQTFKRLFVDLILSFQDRDSSKSYFQRIEPQQAFAVVEVELGFAFDILYTKAPLVYSLTGCILRLLTFSCTCFGLVAFVLCNKFRYHNVDLALTYSLLASAIVLELYAGFSNINSDWTYYWFYKHGKAPRWLHKHAKITRHLLDDSCLHQPNTPRWSGCMAQYSLLSVCLEQRLSFCFPLQKLLPVDQFLEKYCYTYQEVSYNLKELIFKQFKKFPGATEPDPTALCTQRFGFALKEQLPDWNTKVEFDQSILIWHIATDICYYLDGGDYPRGVTPNRKESKQLSDYMLYLLVLHPLLLPIGIGMIRFRDTCAEAREFFKEKKLDIDEGKAKACRRLLHVNTEVPPVKVKGDRSKSVLFDACRLAHSLQLRRKAEKWENISCVWVEMLAYAATHCRGNHHAQQLRKGGELLTHVWLLMAHLGITEQFQINQGHARAKLVAK